MAYFTSLKVFILLLCINITLLQNTEETGMKEIETTEPSSDDENDHPMIICKEPGHFPHPTKCHKYYHCRLYRKKILFMVLHNCHDGTIYDSNNQTCLLPEEIEPKPDCWFRRNYSTQFYTLFPPEIIAEGEIERFDEILQHAVAGESSSTTPSIFFSTENTMSIQEVSGSENPREIGTTTSNPIFIPLLEVTLDETSTISSTVTKPSSDENNVYSNYESSKLMEPEIVEMSDTIKLLEEENLELKNEIRKLRKGLEVAVKANEEMTDYLKRVKCFDMNTNSE